MAMIRPGTIMLLLRGATLEQVICSADFYSSALITQAPFIVVVAHSHRDPRFKRRRRGAQTRRSRVASAINPRIKANSARFLARRPRENLI